MACLSLRHGFRSLLCLKFKIAQNYIFCDKFRGREIGREIGRAIGGTNPDEPRRTPTNPDEKLQSAIPERTLVLRSPRWAKIGSRWAKIGSNRKLSLRFCDSRFLAHFWAVKKVALREKK